MVTKTYCDCCGAERKEEGGVFIHNFVAVEGGSLVKKMEEFDLCIECAETVSGTVWGLHYEKSRR